MISVITPKELLQRKLQTSELPLDSASDIIRQVQEDGDEALARFSLRFDKAGLTSFEVNEEEFAEAFSLVDDAFIEAVKHSITNVTCFHQSQKPKDWQGRSIDGGLVGQVFVPLSRVGAYVPGGTAAYPSTVVMTVVPAKVAGVGSVVVCTPPGTDGKANPYTLVAAKMCKADRVFKLGGAQAVAAMALGTETVPKVDKIVGPGNAYVTAAKKLLNGQVGIDMLAGPSEILIIADESADPRFLAADMLSQAEHDVMAAAVLITTSYDTAKRVCEELERQLELLSRKDIARRSLDGFGAVVIVDDLKQAVELANDYAPEHLEIMTADPHELLALVRNAGAVFLGRYNPEPLGDYMAGPNHVLPTMGSARYRGPLTTSDFLKPINVIDYGREDFAKAAGHTVKLAEVEGLTAHAASISVRMDDMPESENISLLTSNIDKMEKQIKMNANESPFDVPVQTKGRFIERLVDLNLNRYPSTDAAELRKLIAKKYGISDDMVIVGTGSDEIIQMIVTAFRNDIDEVVTLSPTFGMYSSIARNLGMPVVEIGLDEGFEFNPEDVLDEVRGKRALMFLCSPNNPTGTNLLPQIRKVIEGDAGKSVIVVDEAYSEFANCSIMDVYGDIPENVVIMRTLSKAFGLAGMRVGYMLARREMTSRIDDVRLPYNVSSASIVFAMELLDESSFYNMAVRDDLVKLISSERSRMSEELTSLGFKVVPSVSNFFLCSSKFINGKELYERLRERNILVRYIPLLPDYVRITVSSVQENDVLLKAMKDIAGN